MIKIVRTESPSSINTYNQCPRKYFYCYIKKFPTSPSIATVRGNVVHSALEDFYKLDIIQLTKENYPQTFKHELLNLFNRYWTESIPKLIDLNIKRYTIQDTYTETIDMINNFYEDYLKTFEEELAQTTSPQKAFINLIPKTELFYHSDEHSVRGYIDVVHERKEVTIIDYKTSKRDHMTEGYKRQLSIYALLYQIKHNKMPERVGIFFVKTGRYRILETTPEMVESAKKECELMKIRTKSTEIKEYPQNFTPLCNWGRGKCDFYDLCFSTKSNQRLLEH